MSETRSPGGQAAFQYTIHVQSVEHLEALFDDLKKVPDVIEIKRGSMTALKRKGPHAFWALGDPDQ